MIKKLTKNRHGEHFKTALIAIFLSIAVSLIAFLSEGSKITGFAASDSNYAVINPSLIEFKDVNSLGSLAPGNYYIDDKGVVYWIDDESRPPIAKVYYVTEAQKNRQIYIDNSGNVGYTIK